MEYRKVMDLLTINGIIQVASKKTKKVLKIYVTNLYLQARKGINVLEKVWKITVKWLLNLYFCK